MIAAAQPHEGMQPVSGNRAARGGVDADVDNKDGAMLPGAYAQVHFALSSQGAPYTLPGNALLFRPNGVNVATVDDQQRVKLVKVQLGTDYGTRVAIASGLNGNEQVILNPQDSIVDGAPVRIVQSKANAPHPASGASGAPAAAQPEQAAARPAQAE